MMRRNTCLAILGLAAMVGFVAASCDDGADSGAGGAASQGGTNGGGGSGRGGAAAGSGATAGHAGGGVGGSAAIGGSAGASGSAAIGGSAGASGSADGVFRFFPPDHIWNTRVDALPVHAMSDTYIQSSNPSYFMYIGNVMPINYVESTQQKQSLTSLEHPEFSDNIPYPIPDNPLIEDSGGDHHLLICDKGNNLLYELYQPVKASDGTWSAFAAVMFNLSDYALRQDGWCSTDAAGLAVTPGIIRYEELAAGQIGHAMRVAMYTSGAAHTWPARADGNEADPSFPPFGQRFRLKGSFDTTGFSTSAKVILDAWKAYGLMLADNSLDPRAWIIAADTDARWLDLFGGDEYALFNEMQNVHAFDFEAVDVTSLMIDKDSGQARVQP
jgi:hypothetical protein